MREYATILSDTAKVSIPSEIKNNLAIYKISGKPWTDGELAKIANYVNDPGLLASLPTMDSRSYELKWVYSDLDTSNFMYPWKTQNPDPSLTVVPFESLFGKIFKPRPVTKVARV